MLNSIFDQMDFGPLNEFLDDDDVTDISYSNNGQVWVKTLSKGIYQVDRPAINNPFMEKLAFQCSNVMGKTFNMAHPFLDAESAELRMNFIHDSIATNGVACLIRKTPAKIRLNKDKLMSEQYVTEQIHDFLIDCVHGHANIIVAGETGSGKTELVKYLASKTFENEKIISIEDTLELHLDKIYPTRDIVAMKTNNIASYTEALVACMRQNPIWILLSEVRSGEAVLAVRNSISSGHHILSTIHADSAANIPMRMYSLMESSQDIEQFLGSVHRYVQIGIYVKGYFSKRLGRFQREIIEVCEFFVDEDNIARSNMLYKKSLDGKVQLKNPTKHLLDYLSIGNVFLEEDTFHLGESGEGVDDTNATAAAAGGEGGVDQNSVQAVDNIAGGDGTSIEDAMSAMNGESAEKPVGEVETVDDTQNQQAQAPAQPAQPVEQAQVPSAPVTPEQPQVAAAPQVAQPVQPQAVQVPQPTVQNIAQPAVPQTAVQSMVQPAQPVQPQGTAVQPVAQQPVQQPQVQVVAPQIVGNPVIDGQALRPPVQNTNPQTA